MNAISPFKFEDQVEVRVDVDEQGEPVFVAADICRALGIRDIKQAVERLDDDEKGTYQVRTPGGRQQMTVVTESGLYALIMRSDKPEAKKFRKWITSEVLPALRKTGRYEIAPSSPLEQLKLTVQALEQQQAQLAEHERRLAALEAQGQHFSIIGYCAYAGLRPPTLAQASVLGKRATKLSAVMGHSVGKIRDPRFGEVNTYHVDVLQAVFSEKGE